jgi:hypothetical protein
MRDEEELFVPEGKPRFVILWDIPDGEDGEQYIIQCIRLVCRD